MVKSIGNCILSLIGVGFLMIAGFVERQNDVMGDNYYILFFSNIIFFLIGLYIVALIKSESSTLLAYPYSFLVFSKSRYSIFRQELKTILTNPFIFFFLISFYCVIYFVLLADLSWFTAIKSFIILSAQYLFFSWALLLARGLARENPMSLLILIIISINTLSVVGLNLKYFGLQFNPFVGWLYIFNYVYLGNSYFSIIAILVLIGVMCFLMDRISKKLLIWHV